MYWYDGIGLGCVIVIGRTDGKKGVGARGGGGGCNSDQRPRLLASIIRHPIDTQPSTLATTKQASEAAPTVIEGVITGLAPVSCFHGRSTTGRRGLTAPLPRTTQLTYNLTERFYHTRISLFLQGRHGLHVHVYGDFAEGFAGAGACL